MGPLINFLVLMVFLLAGLAQTGSIPKGPGLIAAGVLAVITFILAIVRYKKRKGGGE
jgi:hypothetical protein